MTTRKMKKYSSKRKIKNKTRSRSRKQKMWMMKGCAHSHLAKCKKCMQKGGNCSACGLRQQGGYNPASKIPGPFIGQPWTPKISGWPGVNGIGGDRNYLSQNLYKQDPQLMMRLGGRKKRRGKKTRKGGGLIPQDLVNLGRDISYNMGSTYNALAGYPQPVNPLPYKQPQLSRDSNIII